MFCAASKTNTLTQIVFPSAFSTIPFTFNGTPDDKVNTNNYEWKGTWSHWQEIIHFESVRVISEWMNGQMDVYSLVSAMIS